MEEIKETGKVCIGIDLGTTNSCLSVMENGSTVIINNSTGSQTTPSVISYEDEITVGEVAKRKAVTNPKTTVFASKRLVGRMMDENEAKEFKRLVPFDLVKGPTGEALIKVGEKEVSPVAVSAEILRVLKKDAEDYLGKEVTDVVISVPAKFSNNQKQATKDAGKIAKLNVLRIVSEPTAAALAYGAGKNKEEVVACYDLGGGTFDISIIDIDEGVTEVLSTAGDDFLGGETFDNRLIDYVVNEFKKDEGVDLKEDPMALQRIKDECEKAKKELSTSKSVDLNLPYITSIDNTPKHLVIKITRSKLESMVEDLVDKTIKECEVALKDSGLKKEDIDKVLLVGGMTRMPFVQEKVKEFFGKEPSKGINPDLAVATGCAIQGGIFTGEVKDMLLLDVTPLSLGLETLGGVTTKLIDKNTTIPTSKTQVFSTAVANQPAVSLHVVQGEREMASDNKTLGKFDLTDIPPAPRGVPQINVQFDINADGILEVSAKDLGTGKEQSIKIESSSGLSEEDIEKMVKDAEENAEADKEKRELVDTRNQAEGTINQVEKAMKDNADKIDEDLKEPVEKALEELKENLTSDIKDVIMDYTNSLNEAFHKIAEIIYAQPEQPEQPDPTSEQEDTVDAEYEEVNK